MMKRYFCLLAVAVVLMMTFVPCFAAGNSSLADNFISYLGIGIIAGILVAGIVAGCIIYTYKKKTKSAIYPLGRYADLDLKIREDRFMGSFVTKRRIQTSSNNKR